MAGRVYETELKKAVDDSTQKRLGDVNGTRYLYLFTLQGFCKEGVCIIYFRNKETKKQRS